METTNDYHEINGWEIQYVIDSDRWEVINPMYRWMEQKRVVTATFVSFEEAREWCLSKNSPTE